MTAQRRSEAVATGSEQGLTAAQVAERVAAGRALAMAAIGIALVELTYRISRR